jgi:branched-chain amino acid transport system permease protein
MIFILQHVIDAVALGSLYALAALGIGLIFGVIRLINFSHGDFITIGAFCLIIPTANDLAVPLIATWPWFFLITSDILIVVAAALAAEYLVFRPLRGAGPHTMMIGSFALSFVIQNGILAIYGSRAKAIDLWPSLNRVIVIYGLRFGLLQLTTIAVTIILLGGLGMFLKKTAIGIQMRAAAEDFRMARLLGVRANQVIAAAFALSGILASAVSLLFVSQTGVLSYQMGIPLMLFAFIATVVGGMGSLSGAVLGGFAIGLMSELLQIFLPEDLRPSRDMFLFALIILVLAVRPQGLLRVRSIQERI